jgi:hypothetical protein
MFTVFGSKIITAAAPPVFHRPGSVAVLVMAVAGVAGVLSVLVAIAS